MRFYLSISLSFIWATGVYAGNVDLSTLPPRDTVQLTIYNSEDLTLVREKRQVTFKKGLNTLQFSWAGTLIDPSSLEVSFKTHADQLELLDSTYPHDRPQVVYWNVRSELDGEAQVEILYFTSGLSWEADYVVVTDPDETNLHIESFIRVHNDSGEEYENAQVRLVVGTINLVEMIANLAQMPMDDVLEMSKARDLETVTAYFSVRNAAINGIMMIEESKFSYDGKAQPKEIIKEGLSEYFIYTVEGTENIPNGWSKRLSNFEAHDAEFKIQYRYRPREYGDQLVKMYLLPNDQEHGLGTTPLPDGQVRVFRDNGREGLSYLGEQHIKYVPIGDLIEMNLGPDRGVLHQQVRLSSWRDDFWYYHSAIKVYYSPTKGHDIRIKDRVAGWQDHHRWVERIRNYTTKAIEVEIRRSFAGHVDFICDLAVSRYDFNTPQIVAEVKPGEVEDLSYKITRHQGILSKQNQVTIIKE